MNCLVVLNSLKVGYNHKSYFDPIAIWYFTLFLLLFVFYFFFLSILLFLFLLTFLKIGRIGSSFDGDLLVGFLHSNFGGGRGLEHQKCRCHFHSYNLWIARLQVCLFRNSTLLQILAEQSLSSFPKYLLVCERHGTIKVFGWTTSFNCKFSFSVQRVKNP